MAHVHGRPRCQRCREFRPTIPVRVSRRVLQLCVACQLEVGYSDAAVPAPREAGPRNRSPCAMHKLVVKPPDGFTLSEPSNE